MTREIDIETRLAALEATNRRLEQELAELRAGAAAPLFTAGAARGADAAIDPATDQPDAGLSRRGAFGRIGAAALGATVIGIAARPSAAAAAPQAVSTEGSYDVVAVTGLTAVAPYTGDVFEATARGSGAALNGYGDTTSAESAGVYGESFTGYGVYGSSATGYALFASGGRVGFTQHLPVGPPANGTYRRGDIIADGQGGLFACVVAGSPGSWRMLAAPTSAGQFHPLTPIRVYDSRAALPAPGVLTSGANRVISVADARNANGSPTQTNAVPAGARAVAYNLTIANTSSQGFLAITPGDVTTFSASAINWSGSGQLVANGGVIPLDGARRVRVHAGGGGSTDFLIDITGYYR